MDEFCGTCLQKSWVGKGRVRDSDIIVTGMVIALLGVKYGGLLLLSMLKSKIKQNIFGALK